MKIDQNLLDSVLTSNIEYISGRIPKLMNEADKYGYTTSIMLALPFIQDDYKEGSFKVDYEGHSVNIEILKIKNKTQDPILNSLNNTKINKPNGTIISGGGVTLPNEMYTDNRDRYPYYCARINFPFLLADWLDSNSSSGIRKLMEKEREFLDINMKIKLLLFLF